MLAFGLLPTFGSPARAQRIVTWQLQAIGTTAADPFVGGGFGVGVRQRGRFGFGATASGGAVGGELGARFEGAATFHLDPRRRAGVAPYGGAGLAVVTSSNTAAYVLLVLGIESRPGARRGWFVEVGIGGGLRGSVGIRWRNPSRSSRGSG